ncbi:MAG TPA: nucleotidyltransferase family protein [Verrucomicrobiales bacterium]|nr:nucleotidyltransferase family protein [Verrucomicrobiales bacterium]
MQKQKTSSEKTSGIILAAGYSTRMGRPKLLLPFGKRTVIENLVHEAVNSCLNEVLVITGEFHTIIAEKVKPFGVTLIRNPHPAKGMLSSVRCGLESLDDRVKAIAVIPADQPRISREVINQLHHEFHHTSFRITLPVFNGKRGHPLFFSSEFKQRILTQYDETGLRGLLMDFPNEVLEHPVDDRGVLEDMNTPEDYQKLLKSIS